MLGFFIWICPWNEIDPLHTSLFLKISHYPCKKMKTKSQQFASQAWGCNAKVRQLLNFSKKAKKDQKRFRISLTESSIPTNSGCRKPIITVFCTCWKRWASAARCAWRENAIQNSQRVKPNSLNYSPCRLPTRRWRSNSTDHSLTGPLPCWTTWRWKEKGQNWFSILWHFLGLLRFWDTIFWVDPVQVLAVDT